MRLLRRSSPEPMSDERWGAVLDQWRGVPALAFCQPAPGVHLFLDAPRRASADAPERYRAMGASRDLVAAAAKARRYPRVPRTPAEQLSDPRHPVSLDFIRALEAGGARPEVIAAARANAARS